MSKTAMHNSKLGRASKSASLRTSELKQLEKVSAGKRLLYVPNGAGSGLQRLQFRDALAARC